MQWDITEINDMGILHIVGADCPRHAVLIRVTARLAEFVLRVTVLAGGVAATHLALLSFSDQLIIIIFTSAALQIPSARGQGLFSSQSPSSLQLPCSSQM